MAAEIYLAGRRDLANVDWHDPLADHALNDKRSLWWLSLPGHSGPKWWDLASASPMTLSSGMAWSPQGRPGGAAALSFPGTTITVTASDNGNLRPTIFTVGAWFRCLTASPSFMPIFCKPYNGSVNGSPSAWTSPFISFLLRLNSSSLIEFSTSAGGIYNAIHASYSLNTAQWYRAVGTYDLAAMRLYLNGVQIASVSVSGVSFFSTEPYEIGTDNGGNGNFHGYIDDCFLSSRPWSAAEVAEDYYLGQQGYPGLFHYHHPVAYSLPSGTVLFGAGSATLTASATASASLTLAASGSSSLAGSAAAAAEPTLHGQGSGSLASSASAQAAATLSARGSAILAGSAAAGVSVALPARGDASLVGSATATGRAQAPGVLNGSGSASFTGFASASAQLSLRASGSAAAAGTAGAAPSVALAAAGNASVAGTAQAPAALSLSAGGSAALAGSGSALSSIVLSAIGSALARGSATGAAILPSALFASGSARLVGSATAAATVTILLTPDIVFVEPVRSLLFVEPARLLYFDQGA